MHQRLPTKKIRHVSDINHDARCMSLILETSANRDGKNPSLSTVSLPLTPMLWLFVLSVLVALLPHDASGLSSPAGEQNRRDALRTTAAATIAASTTSCFPALARADSSSSMPAASPNMVIRSQDKHSEHTRVLSVPRVGYSLFKTDKFQAARCVELALMAGVRHFDVATAYGTNQQVGEQLQLYLYKGLPGKRRQDSKTKKQRRNELFISHKLSNDEQSTNRGVVKKNVKTELQKLGMGHLDLCYIHSPLTDKNRRLGTYEALLDLQREGLVKSVGVANYGVNPLNEIVDAGMPPPAVVQLELSPFNQHRDVVKWAESTTSILSCAAWSMLSSPSGPQEKWAILADLAKSKGMTKAQVLIRWAFQKNYLCVPRSGSKKQAEREAIIENSYDGIKDLTLSGQDMEILKGLDIQYPAGKLCRRDGWTAHDVVDDSWDPTLAV